VNIDKYWLETRSRKVNHYMFQKDVWYTIFQSDFIFADSPRGRKGDAARDVDMQEVWDSAVLHGSHDGIGIRVSRAAFTRCLMCLWRRAVPNETCGCVITLGRSSKRTVAFVILITSCKGVYAHQNSHNRANMFFVSAQNDRLNERFRHTIPAGHHVYEKIG
jgi:hypothetical protein